MFLNVGLNELNRTPVKSGPSGGSEWFVTPTSKPTDRTPNKAGGASSKKVFGSLERGLDKMKNMLTPR